MGDIQCEEDLVQKPNLAVKRSFMVQMVLATGIVSGTRDAEYVLLGIAALDFLIISAILFLGTGGTKPMTNAEVQRIILLQLQSR